MTTELIVPFDYGALPADVAEAAKRSAEDIRRLGKRMTEGVILIGNKLRQVRAGLPHGMFQTWLDAEGCQLSLHQRRPRPGRRIAGRAFGR
jgi:hypothetical protein